MAINLTADSIEKDGSDDPPNRIIQKLKHIDSLEVESNQLNRKLNSHGDAEKGAAVCSATIILKLAFQSIGVIYGDLGTSPLYVFSSTFANKIPTPDEVLGALSLIVYTLTLIPLLKYVFIVLQANDNGNGGTFALYSLICRHAKVSQLPNQQLEDQILSNYKLQSPTKRMERASKVKVALESSGFAKQLLLIISLLGTCAVIGDGVLTPAISVLSAIDGIQGKVSSLSTNHVVLISMAILVLLFSVQPFGTGKVGFLFAPSVLIWFILIGGIGVFNVIKHDHSVIHALSPHYIYRYFQRNHAEAWISLGGVVLCITGTEAMFADLAHFTVPSIKVAFTALVYPSLLAAYLGQAAYLMQFPQDVGQTFYKSIPSPLYWPMFVVAVLAAIIASQAMISATFSIVEQSQALGCFPRVKVVHTSSKLAGQVFIPEVNWTLMILCIMITGLFKTTTLLGNAYGIAVMAVMLVTTTLLILIMVMIWQSAMYKIVAFATVFLFIEGMYFSSNLYKFDQGGYIPVAFATILLVIMYVWQYVSVRKYKYEVLNRIPIEDVPNKCKELGVRTIPGVGLIYTRMVQGVPPIYSHFIENLPVMQEVVVFVTLKSLPVPTVGEEERFVVRRVGEKGRMMYRCVARYGYMDGAKRDKAKGVEGEASSFQDALMASLEIFIRREENMEKRCKLAEIREVQEMDGGCAMGVCDGATAIGVGDDAMAIAAAGDGDGAIAIAAADGDGAIAIGVGDDAIAILAADSDEAMGIAAAAAGGDDTIAIVEKNDNASSIKGDGLVGDGVLTIEYARAAAIDDDDHDYCDDSLVCANAEIAFLHQARRAGVTYLLGHAYVQAAPGSSFLNRLVVDVLYDVLRRCCCRNANLALSIPHKRLLKVGMVYHI